MAFKSLKYKLAKFSSKSYIICIEKWQISEVKQVKKNWIHRALMFITLLPAVAKNDNLKNVFHCVMASMLRVWLHYYGISNVLALETWYFCTHRSMCWGPITLDGIITQWIYLLVGFLECFLPRVTPGMSASWPTCCDRWLVQGTLPKYQWLGYYTASGAHHMMISSHGNYVHITGHYSEMLVLHTQRANNAELWHFLYC